MTDPPAAGAGWIDRLPLLRGRFARDTLALAVGLAIAQAVTLVASPFLTRLYSPADFGVYSAFSSVVSALSVVICLSYEAAIVLPVSDEDALTLLELCLALALAGSAVSALAVLLWRTPLAASLQAPQLAAWLWLVPVSLLLVGCFQAFNYWCVRLRRFREVSLSRVAQASLSAGAQLLGRGPGGLVAGLLVGQLVAAAGVAAAGSRAIGLTRLARERSPSRSSYAQLVHRYRSFPLYSSWGTFMNTGAFLAVPLLLSAGFGPAVAGLYFLGFRVASLPLSLLGSAIGQVMLQRSAERLASGAGVAELVELVLGRLLRWSAPPFLALAFVAPPLFSAVFGPEWDAAGLFLRILTPMFFLQFLASPVSAVLIALQRQRRVAVVQAAMFLGTLASLNPVTVRASGPATALLVYSAVLAAIYGAYLALIIRSAGASPAKILRAAVHA